MFNIVTINKQVFEVFQRNENKITLLSHLERIKDIFFCLKHLRFKREIICEYDNNWNMYIIGK